MRVPDLGIFLTCSDGFWFQVLLQSSLKHKSTKKKKKSQVKGSSTSAEALSNNVEKMEIDSDAKMEVEQIA